MHLFQLNDSRLFTNNSCLDHLQPLYAHDLRLFVVGIAGSTIALVSVLENMVLFYVFLSSRKLRRQNYANPVFLATSDIVVSVCYLFMESFHFFAYKRHNQGLVQLWANYMRYTYSLQHFSLTVSNFLLVVASLERYLANGPLYSQRRVLVWIVRHKPLVICLIVLLAFVFKASVFLENGIVYLSSHCVYRVVPVWRTGQHAWKFWLRKLFTIILPFLLLLYFNFYIVVQLSLQNMNVAAYPTLLQPHTNNCRCQLPVTNTSKNRKSIGVRNKSFCTSGKEGFQASLLKTIPKQCVLKGSSSTANHLLLKAYREKRGVRVATRTLVMVVGCYLISNSTTTLLNIWEYFDRSFLRHRHYHAYLIGSNLATLLTICGCALRLPIYMVNDKRIRKAMFRAVLRWRYCLHGQLDDMTAERVLEKWSIVIVSNSLRRRRSFDQLAVVVQNRRSFLVQMTINLGSVQELYDAKAGRPLKARLNGDAGVENTTFLTDIQEESLLEEQEPVPNKHTLPKGNKSSRSDAFPSNVQYYYRPTTGCVNLLIHPTSSSEEDVQPLNSSSLHVQHK